MRIIFAGSGEFGLPTLAALRDGGHEIVSVYTQPDRPAGRGRKLAATPIGEWALARGLAVVRTGNINAEILPPADLLVVIAFGQKISAAIANHATFGSINLHASLLPKYRGAAPIHWAILSGEKITGNSVIRLASRMDAGAVLGQSEVVIGELETTGELHDRLAIDGVRLVMKVADELARGVAVEKPQDESLASAAPKLDRAAAKIDWTEPAEKIAQKIRGLYPWPGCRAILQDAAGAELARVTLVRALARATDEAGRWHPGEIMIDGGICAGDGKMAVEVVEIQPEGKRPMLLADFRRGHAWMPGMRLGEIPSGETGPGTAAGKIL
jgi:methionyl-tRNA formyltransferase